MVRLLRLTLVALAVVGGLTGTARAQDIEPRAYSNAPIGTNFLIVGYADTSGGLAFDPSLPVTDAELDVSTGVLAYAHVVDFWGRSGKVDASIAYSFLSGSAELSGAPIERDVDGFGDARLRCSVNLLGSPALTLKEFAAYQQDLIVGTSFQLSAPTGQYDDERAVNLGTNRWSFKPEVGVSKAIGRLTLEGAAGVTFYTDNDDFFGGNTREQDPLYSMQGHAIYGLGRGVWASADVTYFTGGRTTVDDVLNDDLQGNWRVGATLSFPVQKNVSVKLFASSGVSSRTGNDYDLVGFALQYRWGGGL